jgi:nitrous oxide reductase accessory protein NosL
MFTNKSIIPLILCLLLVCGVSAAYSKNDVHVCHQCGMDLSALAKSRMVIVYADESTVEVCSLHCAAAEIKQNSDKQIKSLMVADYSTEEMIDAKTATWVIGGKKQGVMTSAAKWAFAKKEDAQKFIDKNGGELGAFDEAIKAADQEIAAEGENGHKHSHSGHDMSHMGPGSQLLFNPAFSDDVYHTHPAGMWMVDFKYMHINMTGLRSGTANVPSSSVGFMRNKPYNYMMIPTGMTMDMYMLMVMYGVTDRLTLMAMTNYQANEMKMLMDMGPGRMISQDNPMRTSGFGDTELRGIYKVNNYLVGSLGLSLPTGGIEEDFMTMRKIFRAPYDMQLGSGTYDLKPAITYSALSDDAKWNWGAQAMYTVHTGKNDNDWSFGDSLKLTSWLQRALGPFSSWARLAYTDTGRIRGNDPEINKINHPTTGMGAPMPDADPNNYGGQRLDGFLGVGFTKGPISLGIEGGIPIYQCVNGLQLKTSWQLNSGIQVMF